MDNKEEKRSSQIMNIKNISCHTKRLRKDRPTQTNDIKSLTVHIALFTKQNLIIHTSLGHHIFHAIRMMA